MVCLGLNHMIRLRYICLLLLIILSACTSLPPKEIASTTSDKPLPDTWQIKGKLGVRSETRNGSLSVNWQQTANQYTIHTQAALGQGATTLRGDENRIVITQVGKDPITSDSPRLLVADTFGWELPLDDLQYWVKGIPTPDDVSITAQYDEFGNLTELEQSGWQLSFSRYQQVADWALPGRIRATRNSLTLTLIIRDWIL